MLGEAAGVLAWAAEGAKVRWRIGLDQPAEIAAANHDWKAENDHLGRFIVECCVIACFFRGRARPLYEWYRQWAEGAGGNADDPTNELNADADSR